VGDTSIGGDYPAYTQFRPSPDFLGGRFGSGSETGWNLTWVYLERSNFSYDSNLSLVPTEPPTPDTPWITGEAFRRMKADGSWYGLSFARRLGERTAIGVTPYLAYRSHEQRIQFTVQSLDPSGSVGMLYLADYFKYWNMRALAKLGLAYDGDRLGLGVTVTTPSLGLTGGGEIFANIAASGLDADGDGTPDEVIGANRREDLEARWKTPLSVAVGASWRLGRTGLHATVEWFDAVPDYSVIDTGPLVLQSPPITVPLDLNVHLRSVVNFGVGIDHGFNERFSVYGAFRTDRSAQIPGAQPDVLLTTWDLWHATAGSSFQFLGIELTTGLEYAYGSGRTRGGLGLTAQYPVEQRPLAYETDGSYSRWKLLIGFDLALLTGDK